MKGTPLDTVPKHKHLGVTITEKLDWSPHCNTITSKANRTLGVYGDTLRVAWSLSSQPRTRHWSDLNWSINCSSVWDPYHQMDKATLERVQRRAARFVTGLQEGIQRYHHDQQLRVENLRRTKSSITIDLNVQNNQQAGRRWHQEHSIAAAQYPNTLILTADVPKPLSK